jgi:uncharacterized protein (TIGR02118 family)
MIKVMLFLKRKPGLTHEEFRNYYESTHAPLALRHTPLEKYARNFFSTGLDGSEPPYDCVTEFWFKDEKTWNDTRAWAQTPEGKVLAIDEANFMDRSSMRVFVVEECVS